ncbi:hypothetical protein VTN00DRAFT_10096 [Thermoascus crustaceus]|uniref:uncharacterized protein n=1 Tax=Thermoascus crustaceus TaxID=5088 RepID=UPI003742B004
MMEVSVQWILRNYCIYYLFLYLAWAVGSPSCNSNPSPLVSRGRSAIWAEDARAAQATCLTPPATLTGRDLSPLQLGICGTRPSALQAAWKPRRELSHGPGRPGEHGLIAARAASAYTIL